MNQNRAIELWKPEPAEKDSPIHIRTIRERPLLAERTKLQREVSRETDVAVPFLQALMSALVVGILAAGLALWFAWSWKLVLVLGSTTLALAWFWRLGIADSLLWQVESVFGLDLDRDGQVGTPQLRNPVVVNAHEARVQAASEVRETRAETERMEVLRFVDACFIAGTSEAAHGIHAGGAARTGYLKNRDTLLQLGIAEWKNPSRPRSGWRMAVSRAKAVSRVETHVL